MLDEVEGDELFSKLVMVNQVKVPIELSIVMTKL